MSISVHADRTLIRAGTRSRRFIRVALEAPPAPPRTARLPANIAFVLDRSGSMKGGKIDKAREAIVLGILSLRDEDRFAVVAYDDRIDVVVPSSFATPEARHAAIAAVQGIESRGSTDLCGGWLRGCGEVAEHLRDAAVGRCILLTDGLANAGIRDHDEIIKHVTALRERRVTTSVLGVGADFDEILLGRMADAGGGNFHFIEGAAQIPEFIAQEVGEALAVTARDVVIVVDAQEGVSVDSLNDFPCHRDGGAWRIAVGSLFAGQTLAPVLSLWFPEGVTGNESAVMVRVEDRDGAFGMPPATVRFTWAGHAENDRQARDRVVDRDVATLFAAQAAREALARNRSGDFDGARDAIERCAQRIREYAGDDPVLLAVLQDLELKKHELARKMDMIAQKRSHYASRSSLKGRSQAAQERPPSKVVLLPTGQSRGLVRRVVPHLAEVDPDLFGDLTVDDSLQGSQYVASGPDGTLAPRLEARLVEDARQCAANDAVRIVFVPYRLSDNWFSHWHAAARTAVVSLADWDGAFGVSPRAFVAYEVMHHGLHAVAPAYDPLALAHGETRGCLMDFCRTRADIEVKLQTADLCPACRRGMAAMGLPVERLLHLADLIRTLATPLPVHER